MSHGPQPHRHLAEQMRCSLEPRPPAEADDPFPEDRAVDQGLSPERGGDRRTFLAELPDRLMGDEGELAIDRRREAVVHDIDMKTMQIRNVARNVEGDDLTLALDQGAIAMGEPGQEQAAIADALPLLDDVAAGLHAPQRRR